jgi:hypothetical protein
MTQPAPSQPLPSAPQMEDQKDDQSVDPQDVEFLLAKELRAMKFEDRELINEEVSNRREITCTSSTPKKWYFEVQYWDVL